MPVEEAEWASIFNMIEREIERVIGRRRDYFLMTVVKARDEINNLVWVPEFNDPVPCFMFDYEIIYYDTVAGGGPPFTTNTVQKKFAKVRPLCPLVNDTVLIAREMGADRLPRCLGVLRSNDFIRDEDEEDD